MKNTYSALGTRLSALLVVSALAASPLVAQARPTSKLDRTKMPDAGKPAELRIPPWTKTTLANGAELVISRKTGLPLVSVMATFHGGTAQFEEPAKAGIASLVSGMLSEGTSTRSGDDLSNAQQLLGTSIGFVIRPENGNVGFTSLTSKFEPALELMADMLLNPSFPDAALTRRKAQMKVSLVQGRDQPGTIAGRVFSKVLYGDEHPYGRLTTEATVESVTRDDIVAFHRAYFQPGRAVITVVGDVDPEKVRAAFDKAFAQWAPGGSRPSYAYPPVPHRTARTIYLVDKPKTPQSVMWVGMPGPSRATPDYYAISVMNTILGGLFQSRLNRNLREEKGYTYGAGSGFAFGRGPGSFRAGSSGIHTTKTDSALVELMKELRDVQGGRPFSADEIQQGKESLIQSLPETFGSVGGIASALAGPLGIYTQDLPETYYHEFAAKVNAVTADDLVRVAKQYIDLDKLAIVVVGDRAVIEEPLRKTGIAPIVYLDIEGKPVITP
jgi:zinc protease